MSTKLIFSNGEEINVVRVEEGPEFYDNAQRRVLRAEVQSGEAGLEDINTLLSNGTNLAQIRHVNTENGAEDVFDNYKVKMELAVRQVAVGQNSYGEELTEEHIIFKLGRLTPVELRLQELGVMV